MPRQARLDVPGALHHIMVRGINRYAIFKDDQDKVRFLDRLSQDISEGHCFIYAWVLMDNHIHLLFRSGKQGISAVMRRLLTWYAQYYNRRHRRSGHLFENRYKSILCDEEAYLLVLVRYIHLNPIRANIITTIKALDHYPWSGHSVIMGNNNQQWMDTDHVLSYFSTKTRAARNAYRRFVEEGMSMGRSHELTGGGLIRSHGGWSQVIAMRRRGQKEESDERILGDGDFVQVILQEAEERQLRQLKVCRSGGTIAEIIDEECGQAKISPQEIKNGSRGNAVSRTCALIAYRSREELGLSAAEIARHLGVATSSITRAINKMVEGAG
ncbi:MAG: transposase [Thermodesulfobacteriota bacterium]